MKEYNEGQKYILDEIERMIECELTYHNLVVHKGKTYYEVNDGNRFLIKMLEKFNKHNFVTVNSMGRAYKFVESSQ